MVLLHQATENCLAKEGIIKNGFKRAGLVPWDPSAPDVSKLLPGTIFSGQSFNANEVVNQSHILPTISTELAVSIVPAGGAVDMVSIPETHIPVESPNEDVNITTNYPLPGPSDGDMTTPPSDIHCPILSPLVSSSNLSAINHDSSDQFNMNYEFGDIGFLEDSSEVTEDIFDDGNIIISDPIPLINSNENSPPIQGSNSRSLKCPNCSKGIPEPVLKIHLSNFVSVTSVPPPLDSPILPMDPSILKMDPPLLQIDPPILQMDTPQLTTLPEQSLKDRQRQLTKFEMVMLTEKLWKNSTSFFLRKILVFRSQFSRPGWF